MSSSIDELLAAVMNVAISAGMHDSVGYLTRIGEDIAASRYEAAIKSRPSNLYNRLLTLASALQDGEVIIINTTDNKIRSTIHQFARQHQLQSRAAVYENFDSERLFRCKHCKKVSSYEEMNFKNDWSMDGSQSFGSVGKCECEDGFYHTGEDENDDFHTWDTYNAVVLSKGSLDIPATSMSSKKQLPVSYHAKSYEVVEEAALETIMDTFHCTVYITLFTAAVARLKFGMVKTK